MFSIKSVLPILSFALISTISISSSARTLFCNSENPKVNDTTKPLTFAHSMSAINFDPAATKGGLKGTLRIYIASKKTDTIVNSDFSNLKRSECGFQDRAMLTTDPNTITFKNDVLVSVNSQHSAGSITTMFFSSEASQFNYPGVYSMEATLNNGQWAVDNASVKKVK